MLIIEINALDNGAHNNQTINGSLSRIPDGWAVVPDGIEVPDTFPFVDIEVDGQTVISMTPGVVPEAEPVPDHVPTLDERVTTLEESNAEMSEALDLLLSGVTE